MPFFWPAPRPFFRLWETLILELVFYGDLVYKFKKIVGKPKGVTIKKVDVDGGGDFLIKNSQDRSLQK